MVGEEIDETAQIHLEGAISAGRGRGGVGQSHGQSGVGGANVWRADREQACPGGGGDDGRPGERGVRSGVPVVTGNPGRAVWAQACRW
ncbi:hypothetical protein GCM10010277_78760 [Streptomyces longisporoflavus]|nr:hypothetical protein GCM10010277_78760 [Streptomyces longisporoflavus]